MSNPTIRIDKELLEDAKQYLIENHGLSKGITYTTVSNRVFSLFLYGVLDHREGKEIMKQRLRELGATEEDYTKGRVRTWARERLYTEDSEPTEERKFSPKLESTLKEVITEHYQEENILPRKEVIREEPEEVQIEKVPEAPPWQDVPMIAWEEIHNLYPLRKENPFLIYAKDGEGNYDELKVYAIRIVLKHLPQQDRASQEAWNLINDLYKRFKEWREKYADDL